jgi:hypothetical protein
VTATAANPLISDYLERLRAAAASLPRAEREELVRSIEEHVQEALTPDMSEAERLNVLDRIGEPEQLVAEARGGEAEVPARRFLRRGRIEVAALILLPLGSFLIPYVGWFIGVGLLWMSDVWNTKDKLIGTFVIPGGLFTPLVVGAQGNGESCFGGGYANGRTFEHCHGGYSTTVQVLIDIGMALLFLAPVASAFYLGKRAKRAAAAT